MINDRVLVVLLAVAGALLVGWLPASDVTRITALASTPEP